MTECSGAKKKKVETKDSLFPGWGEISGAGGGYVMRKRIKDRDSCCFSSSCNSRMLNRGANVLGQVQQTNKQSTSTDL